jgi:UDP-glucose 4-epimerase
MRVLVTGGAGFIGSHIAEYHIKKGDQVHVIDNLSTGSLDNVSSLLENKNFTLVQDDVLTGDKLKKLVVQVDRIYHMAAVVGMFTVLRDPQKTLATNIAGSERLLRAVVETKRKPQIIIASSSEVYGVNICADGHKEDDQLTIGSPAKSRWNYAISKLADEAFGLTYHREHNLPILVIRFFNTVGPRQRGTYGMVLPRFVEQAISGKPITVFGDGNQIRCFINIYDTVRLLDLLANKSDAYGQIFNIGSDHEISIMELAKLVKKLSNSKSEIKTVSYQDAYNKDYEDIKRRKPNLMKLRSYIPVAFNIELEQTIKELIERKLS